MNNKEVGTIYKLLLIPLLLVVWLHFYTDGVNQKLAMNTYYKGKQAVNRGAQAGALQLDDRYLAEGVFAIDKAAARQQVERYLYANLQLTDQGQPTDTSFIRSPVDIIYFEVLDPSLTYPYEYSLPQYNFYTTFERPAVIVVAQLSYMSVFSTNNLVKWNIVGSAQLVHR